MSVHIGRGSRVGAMEQATLFVAVDDALASWQAFQSGSLGSIVHQLALHPTLHAPLGSVDLKIKKIDLYIDQTGTTRPSNPALHHTTEPTPESPSGSSPSFRTSSMAHWFAGTINPKSIWQLRFGIQRPQGELQPFNPLGTGSLTQVAPSPAAHQVEGPRSTSPMIDISDPARQPPYRPLPGSAQIPLRGWRFSISRGGAESP
jgi:hypothetical protein